MKSTPERLLSGLDQREATAAGVGFRPLYRQVKDLLLRRLADGVWQPGQILPSEPEIAANLGVSQGTVRKALDEMTAENLLVRRQGRGTFVARHDEERILFRFFRLQSDTGERQFP
jgi:GntR family transcriptional regulator